MSHSSQARNPAAGEVPIQGFEEVETDTAAADWDPVSDRLIRVGLAGQGVCSFGGAFHFQDHPNVEIGAVAELDPDKRAHEGWRTGLPPQWYPTHSNAYYIGVTAGRFTEVSCMGLPSALDYLQPENNRYGNPYGTEIALFRTSEGGMSRMAVSWDTPGLGGERGRLRAENGSFYGEFRTADPEHRPPPISRPPLPPGVGSTEAGKRH